MRHQASAIITGRGRHRNRSRTFSLFWFFRLMFSLFYFDVFVVCFLESSVPKMRSVPSPLPDPGRPGVHGPRPAPAGADAPGRSRRIAPKGRDGAARAEERVQGPPSHRRPVSVGPKSLVPSPPPARVLLLLVRLLGR